MLTRTLFVLSLVVVFSQCEKTQRPPSSTGYLPTRIYISAQPKDTANALVIDYQYDTNGFIRIRQKRKGNSILENIKVEYRSNRQVSRIDYVSTNGSGNFEFAYDPANLRSTIVHNSSVPGTKNFYTYTYVKANNSMNYAYPSSSLGRVLSIVDSVVVNDVFVSKETIGLGYSALNTNQRNLFTARKVNYPNTPVISTLSGQFSFDQKYLSNPFINVFPDFLELPPIMWEPAPFNRAGFLTTYAVFAPNSPSTERDSYQAVELVGETSMPQLIRKTMDGRRSGTITEEYLYIFYNK
jgi:hypothetical protein